MYAAVRAALAWVFGKFVSDKVLAFVAQKALAIAIVTVVLPIVLNNLIYDLLEMVVSIVNSSLAESSLESASIGVTGVASWLFQKCKIGESFSVIISAISVRAALNMIPFVRI